MAEQERACETLFERLRTRLHDLLGMDEAPAGPCPFPCPGGECTQERVAMRALSIMPGAVVINGVALQESVVEQLAELGLPLKWYNHGELEEVAEATGYDCTLIKNPGGASLHDKLHYAPEKKEMHELLGIASAIGRPVRALTLHMFGIGSWGDAAGGIEEQIDDIRAFAHTLCGPEPIPATALFSE